MSPLPIVVRWYLARQRNYTYHGLKLVVLPGVFHPGLFFSTRFLTEFVENQYLSGMTVLEVGAGTGIISLMAARQGAQVTATDISNTAIRNLQQNAQRNNQSITVLNSDLFTKVPGQRFDWIFVNPPYYPRNPARENEYAWYCGEHHEYFVRFFAGLGAFRHDSTQVIMVLSDVCNLATIFKIADKHGYELRKIASKAVWADGYNYLFSIKPVPLIPREENTRTAGKQDSGQR